MRVLYGDALGFLAELSSPQVKMPGLSLAMNSGQHSLTHKTKSAFLAKLTHEPSFSQRASILDAHQLDYAVKTAERMVKVARIVAAAGK